MKMVGRMIPLFYNKTVTTYHSTKQTLNSNNTYISQCTYGIVIKELNYISVTG